MSWLEFHGVTKRFPGVLALDRVSFGIEKGECHALMGENGAGKSTLGKILAGVCRADAGKILLDGKSVSPEDPLEARHLGIAMVHQELAFCPNLTVAENLCLGDLPRRGGFVSRGRMRENARQMLGEIEADIDPTRPIAQLSTGEEQMVQIAAALGMAARIIVMDEPTSSLSARESEHLFSLLAKLKKRGVTIVYVSHRMEEIFLLCDRLSVLRDGRHIATEAVGETSRERVIHQMIGRELTLAQPKHSDVQPGPEALRVEKLSSPGKFQNISFVLHRREILGLAGLVGAGRSEVAEAVFGLDPSAEGRIFTQGKPTKINSPEDALAAGIGFLPEDRKRQGLVLTMNCRENTTLAALDRLLRAGFIRRKQERALAREYSEKLRVKTPALDARISGLSGGNQQKIAIAKWLACECDILIVDEPTRGVDVGVKAEIHQLLDQLACQGTAILLISSELPEIMNLSSRIIVLREGVPMGELARAHFSQEALMRMMSGIGQEFSES
ncbi:MAG TPA: sugar ABC transporter ATP-binding protein [Verrucomicrobiae bacterium]|jgi:ABC-type sugar transport system ATPase subunit|nr:sugar ABC transporter ATP-binding protein [Verrucomicrobiae bacterium]